MISISELQKFNFENPPNVGLCREIKIQEKYDKFLENPENTNKFVSSVKEQLTGKKYILLKNAFPYHIPEGIQHKVCWFTDCNPNEILAELKSQMDVITCWRNTPTNCSILEIKHLHVFVRM